MQSGWDKLSQDSPVKNNKKSRSFHDQTATTMWCFWCGSSGHLANSSSCCARTLQCRNCKKVGHIEKVCKMPLNANINTVSGVSVQVCSSDDNLPLCTENAAVASDIDTCNIFSSSCAESSSYDDVALIHRDEMHDVLKVVKINGQSITVRCDTGLK